MKTERKAVFGMAAWGVVLLFLVGSFSSMAYLDSHMLRVTDSTATNQSNADTQKINGLDLSRDYRIVGIPGLTKEREQFLMEETKKVLREHPAAFKSVDELRAYNPDAVEPTPMELSRGTRAGDVNLTYCEYGVVNQGWAGNWDYTDYPGTQSLIGCFFNGKPSTITAHITNGDSTPAIVNARLVIKDFYGEETVNTTKSVTVAPGGEGTVTYDWTPEWVSSQAILLAQQQGTSLSVVGIVALRGFEINITIDTTSDNTPDNNVWDDVVLVGELVDDAEHGESVMSGDKSSTTWHITDSPANTIKKGNHSGTHAWYCGTDGVTDHYGANMDARLISPSFDLSTYDTTHWYVMNWNIMAGATEEGDGINIEWSTDDGATWDGLFQDPGIGGANAPPSLATEWGSLTPVAPRPDGNYSVFYGFPYPGGSDDMSHVRFSYHFTSNDAGGAPGYYLDDFILMGVQITHDVGVSNITVSNHIMRVGQQMSITVEGKNYGMKAENNVFYNMSIYKGLVNSTQKKDATPVDTPQSQTLSTLGVTAKASKTFHWTPTEAGLYTIWFQVTSAEDQANDDDEAGALIHVNPTDPGSVLVVDDESLGAYGEHNITAALDANSYTYDVYTMGYYDNGPSASDMEAYDLVIWRVGQSSSTLTTADQSSIDTYLSHGGSLWLIGEDILYDLVDAKNGAVSGWSNTGLHVATVQHDVGLPNPLVGVSGDPITDGMSLATTGSGWGHWGDDITPASGAVGIFNSAQTNFSAIRYKDDSTSGKLVFFAFDFNDLVDTTDQANVVKAVYSWMVGGIEITGVTDTAFDIDPSATENVQVTVHNIGGEDDVGTITVDAPTGYTIDYPDTVNVPGSGGATFYVNVTAPEAGNTEAGQVDNITVSVASANSGKSADISLQFTINEVKDLILSTSDDSQSGAPGDDVDFTITVKNNGNKVGQTDDIAVSVKGDEDWGSVDSDTVSIATQQTDTVTVTISIPDDNAVAKAGKYNFQVNAAIGTSVTKTLPLTVTVTKVPGVTMTTTSDGASVDLSDTKDPATNKSIEFTATVTNTGNAKDNFTFELSGLGAGWEYDVKDGSSKVSQIELNAGQYKDVTVTVYVPGNDMSTKKALTFAVKSVSSATTTSTTTFNVTVLRPDLKVNNATVDHNKVDKGKKVTVSFTVMNTGNGEAKSVNVKVVVLKGEKEVSNQTISVGNVPAGGSRDGSVVVKGNDYGSTYTVKVIVDPDDNVKERSESAQDGEVTFKTNPKPSGSPGFGAMISIVGLLSALAVAGIVLNRRREE